MSWQHDSIVVPSTKLELEDNHADWLCAADQDAPDSPPWVGDDEDGSCDPPSLSRTPSGDLLALAHWQDSTSAPQETWSQYRGTIVEEHRVPIEAQMSGQVIGDRWTMGPIIGRGSFGCCYKATDKLTGQQVAVKVANGVRTYSHDGSYQYDEFLQVEWRAHQRFSVHGAAPCGYPDILAAGIHNFSPDLSDDRPLYMVSFLAMELLGPTCWEAANIMHAQQDAIFGGSAGWSGDEELHMPARLPTTEWIVRTGQGMLKALADVHRRGFIHRDVKTENFCLDAAGSNKTIKIIDFGFSRMAFGYYSFRTDYDKRVASFWGTPNYASLSALMSYPQTPRDDLECVVYCLFEMEMPTLRLPWNRTLTTNEEAKEGWSMKQLERMSNKKREAWLKACKQGQVPDYLMGFFQYITSVGPREVPDYEWLVAQLESGITGQPPSRPPLRTQIDDWPSPETQYCRADFTMHAIAKVSSAASKILPPPASMRDTGSHARPTQQKSGKRCAESKAASGQQQHKRARGLNWPPGELSDEEDPASQGAGLPQLHELAGQRNCAVAAKHTPKCLLDESQATAEE